MKNFTLLILLIGISLGVNAADVTVSWDADPAAVSYRVYQSIDAGTTWTLEAESTTLPIIVPVPDAGLVLLQGCAVSALVEVCRTETGFFYNGDWKPPKVINLSTP